MSKSSDGRKDCDLCTDDTVGEPIAIFFDPNREPGDRVIRMHLKHLKNDPELYLNSLVGEWDCNIPKQRKNFRKPN